MKSQHEYVGESERLRLRKFTMDDFDFLFEIFNNQKAMEFFPGLRDQNQTRGWIELTFESYRTKGHGKWLIESKADGRRMGHTGLVMTDVDGLENVELGYFLHPQFWNQGYAVEAAKVALKLAQEKFNYKKVISAINPKNQPSIQVAKRLGMSFEKNGTASVAGYQWNADIYSLSK